MPRQPRESSGTGIYHVMMRGINHQNIFEDKEDYYQFLTTLDVMAQSYEPDGTPGGRNYILYAYCLMSNHILLRYLHQNPLKAGIVTNVNDYEFSSWQEYCDKDGVLFPLCDTQTVLNRIPYNELNALVYEPLSDDVTCLDIEEASKGRPSDDQVMMFIKEKTGATNISAFQQLPDEIRRSVLVELKGRRASLRQLERLTGIGKSMIYRM